MYTYTHFCGHFLWPNPNGSGRKHEEIPFLATSKTNIGQTARLHKIIIDKKTKNNHLCSMWLEKFVC